MQLMRWPSKDPRDFQSRARAQTRRTRADDAIARAHARGPQAATFAVRLTVGAGPGVDERVWTFALPLN